MGMASGERNIYFGTDVGLPKGDEKTVLHVSSLRLLRLLWRIQISNKGEKHEKDFDSLTTSKLALGCWPIHLSPVTRHLGGGGGECAVGGGTLGGSGAGDAA